MACVVARCTNHAYNRFIVGKWDAVVTCFFIDTAKNIVDYLETIHKVLKTGGVWINAGRFTPQMQVQRTCIL